eukprot:15446878-Alexandrium_andersonii.AAC.1
MARSTTSIAGAQARHDNSRPWVCQHATSIEHSVIATRRTRLCKSDICTGSQGRNAIIAPSVRRIWHDGRATRIHWVPTSVVKRWR